MDDAARFEVLRRLSEVHGNQLRGKILQRLLELAFDRLGFRLVEERISEGTDFDIVRRDDPSQRYSFEARTSISSVVTGTKADILLMDAREVDGYQAGLAALRISPGSQWILVKRSWLLPPSLRVSIGTSPGWEALAVRLNDAFDTVLRQLAPLALEGGLEALEPFVRAASAAA